MKQHADPRVHEFAELIAESGDGWQTDRKIYEFIRFRRSGNSRMGDLTVRQVITDVTSLIEASGPDWLSDWYTVDEICRALAGDITRVPIQIPASVQQIYRPRPLRTVY